MLGGVESSLDLDKESSMQDYFMTQEKALEKAVNEGQKALESSSRPRRPHSSSVTDRQVSTRYMPDAVIAGVGTRFF